MSDLVDRLKDAADSSRRRLHELKYEFEHVLAKIYVRNDRSLEVLTNENRNMCDKAVVFVGIPPIFPLRVPGPEYTQQFRNVASKADAMLSAHAILNSHPMSSINISELIERGFIYSRVSKNGDLDINNRPITPGTVEYWYKVQDTDILSGFKAQFKEEIHGTPGNEKHDDVARGHIRLVSESELNDYFIMMYPADEFDCPRESEVERAKITKLPDLQGGNKCSLKPKSNKRKKKQTKRSSRRPSKTRKRNTRK